MRAFVALTLLTLCLPSAGLTQGEDVYYCTDVEAAGILWDEGDRTGPGVVGSFVENRYTMKVLPGQDDQQERIVTATVGDMTGRPEKLQCVASAGLVHPTLWSCRDALGMEAWLFEGDRYTRAYLYGYPVSGEFALADPNIIVAHGTCTKF